MTQKYITHLLALHQQQDWAKAARACGISEAQLATAIEEAEAEYRHALVRPGRPFQGFTAQGEQFVAWAGEFVHAVDQLKRCFATSKGRSLIAPLLARRSVSPKRLGLPGPDGQQIDLMIEAALCAPDHGGLHPWHVLVLPGAHRQALADLFEQEKRRRDPLASRQDLQRSREHATRSPALLAFIVSPQPRSRIPVREQWLAAGAALGNLLNAAHQMGFGAIVLSGERCFDPDILAALGIGPTQFLAGFISLGSVAQMPAQRAQVSPDAVRSHWQPAAGADAGAPARPAPADHRHGCG